MEQKWSYNIKGGGVPVIAGNKVYQFGYYGEGERVEESLTCLNIENGELIWDKQRQDFISDIVYDRYGVGVSMRGFGKWEYFLSNKCRLTCRI